MLIKNKKIIFILILAALIRFWNIKNFPSLNPDEAALGYNAYSLLKTGRDEHGASWPIHFKSFGDNKPGGYFYLALPFVASLGLNPLAVRFPNLILSILTIYFLFKLVHLLSRSKKLALLSALVLTLSPWHIHFSRGAWESNTALSLILIGTYFFYRSRFFLSIILFVASLYTYHSARLIAPLIFLTLLINKKQTLLKNYQKLIKPALIGFLLVLPVSFSFLRSGTTRFAGVGLTADPGPLSRSHELLNHHANTKLVNRIIHNKRVLYLISWAEKYFSHFNLNFLFVNGDQVPRSKSPEMGQLHLIELPLLLFGLFRLIKHKNLTKLKKLLLPWLFIAPLASSLTFQAPSALRSLTLVVPLTILIAIGLQKLLSKKTHHLLFSLLYLVSFFYYLDAYFIHSQKRYPFAWNTSFKEMVSYLNSQKANYQHVYITTKYDQPYILYLFYSKYPPKKIQSQIQLTPPDQFGFSTVAKIDNINFQPIYWQQIPKDSLVVAATQNIALSPKKIINFPSGAPAFKIYIK